MNTRASLWILMTCAMTWACGARPAGPTTTMAPPPSRQVLETKVAVWQRDTAPPALPALARHVQLIITPGWTADQNLAWLIANGTELVAVFQCTPGQRGEIFDAASHLVLTTAGTPIDKIAFGVLGSISPTPPPPPYPGGIPGLPVERIPQSYVQGVLQGAWNLNSAQERLEGAATAP